MLKGLLRGLLRPAGTKASPAAGADEPAASLQRASAAAAAGDLAQAEAILRDAARRYPTALAPLAFRAELLQQAGRETEALEAYRAALALDPGQRELRFAYAAALVRAGARGAARDEYRRLVTDWPNWEHPKVNLGAIALEEGDLGTAVGLLRSAVALAPDLAAARITLALALKEAGAPAEAEAQCLAVLAAAPDNLPALKNLAAVRLQTGDADGAREVLARRHARAPTDAALIAAAVAIPAVPTSHEEIATVRRRLEAEIDALAARPLSVADPVREVGTTTFYLAYHGENDRLLHEKVARLHLRACPGLGYVAPHVARTNDGADGRLRIGFVSRYLYDHSIGNVIRGLVARLDRRRFSPRLFAFRSPFDTNSRAMAADADQWTVLGQDLAGAREAIARQQLDVLFYPDVGMDPFTYFLTFARLARVQCTTWGHPVSTGVPAMDYFLSTDYFEPPAAAEHYSERLELLRDVAFPGYYYRPELPPAAAPEALGFDRGRHVYFCPQALFKFHPDFDGIIGGILRRDPRGEIALVGDPERGCIREARLQARLRDTLGVLAERVVFLPRTAQRGGYLQRLQACHVVLDTVRYCGGNTSLEAISAGALVVTLPGPTMRARHTYGFFRKIGFMDTVVASAEAYVDLAVRIATDAEFRAHLRAEQRARADALYEDDDAVAQIEAFFVRSVASAAP